MMHTIHSPGGSDIFISITLAFKWIVEAFSCMEFAVCMRSIILLLLGLLHFCPSHTLLRVFGHVIYTTSLVNIMVSS